MEKFQNHRIFRLTILKTSCIESGIIGESKLQRPALSKGTFRKYCSKTPKTAYESDEIAAPIAASRTAAYVTSRCRDVENNVDANFSVQQRGLSSEIDFESVQTLEAQRHMTQEVTAEMIRRGARNANAFSQLRSEHFNRVIYMLKVKSINFSIFKQKWDNIWILRIEKTRTSGACMRRSELRIPDM